MVLEHRNSAENDCGNATMKSLWRVPVRRGAWIRILQHVRWSTDPGIGYIATWINGRPGAALARRRLEAHHAPGRRGPHPHLDAEERAGRRSTCAQCKSHPCAHLRNGVYRDPTVRGDSVVYVDGTTVAKTRAAAEAGARVRR